MKSLTGITVLLLVLSACVHGYPFSEVEKWIKIFNKISCNEAVRLYTPEVEDNCLGDAVECFRDELLTISKKCMVQEDGLNAIDHFDNLLAERTETSKPTGRCACKLNPEKPFQYFREQLVNLINKQMNS